MLSTPLMKAITETNLATALYENKQYDQAIAHYERAIAQQPDYAPAYAGLADYYLVTYELQPRVAMAKAEEYVQRALALDNTLAEAHLTLAGTRYADGRFTTRVPTNRARWGIRTDDGAPSSARGVRVSTSTGSANRSSRYRTAIRSGGRRLLATTCFRRSPFAAAQRSDSICQAEATRTRSSNGR